MNRKKYFKVEVSIITNAELDEKIKKAENHIFEYKQKYGEALQTIDTIKRNLNNEYISKLELERKLEEYKNMLNNLNKKTDIDRIKAINERIIAFKEMLGE